ncbi:MAG: phosphomannomutase/phosphoglucomutase [Candidatus Aminicenantes bacterium]|nr:phosphomannomutase/phosphoglucomutase [Candidatus Aminicenantes bacterium]
MKINPEIFREYDIRGIVDKDLNEEVVETLGRGIGTTFRRNGKKKVALGWDCRLSSPGFASALSRGILSTGCSITEYGIIPTPLLYFAVYVKNMEAGVMITGSHNPPEHNGFKLMLGKDTLYGDDIQKIKEIIQKEDYITDKKGTRKSYDIVPEYKEYIIKNLQLERSLKMVIDAGNGTGGVVAVPIFQKLGCEVIPLFCEMDGRFPNHHPDPTVPEDLRDLIGKVGETSSDLGIAYDGDTDRIGVIDDRGGILWGDQLLILFARDILPAHPGAAVISEVKASQTLYDEITRLGGKAIMWKTGHSLIKKKIKEEKALIAGEMSGHMFFADRYFGFDDAIYATGRLLEILSRKDKKLSEMLDDLPKAVHTPEIRVYASDEVKFKIVEQVKKELARSYPIIDIDGVRATFPKGWALVRPSNTQEVLVMRFEAENKEALENIQAEVKTIVETAIKKLKS